MSFPELPLELCFGGGAGLFPAGLSLLTFMPWMEFKRSFLALLGGGGFGAFDLLLGLGGGGAVGPPTGGGGGGGGADPPIGTGGGGCTPSIGGGGALPFV